LMPQQEQRKSECEQGAGEQRALDLHVYAPLRCCRCAGHAAGEHVRPPSADDGDGSVVVAQCAGHALRRVVVPSAEEVEVGSPAEAPHWPEEERGCELGGGERHEPEKTEEQLEEDDDGPVEVGSGLGALQESGRREGGQESADREGEVEDVCETRGLRLTELRLELVLYGLEVKVGVEMVLRLRCERETESGAAWWCEWRVVAVVAGVVMEAAAAAAASTAAAAAVTTAAAAAASSRQ